MILAAVTTCLVDSVLMIRRKIATIDSGRPIVIATAATMASHELLPEPCVIASHSSRVTASLKLGTVGSGPKMCLCEWMLSKTARALPAAMRKCAHRVEGTTCFNSDIASFHQLAIESLTPQEYGTNLRKFQVESFLRAV